jgi:hypothetical protein
VKALTIRQPWAELIMLGVKDVENRSRRTTFRGRFAVHVSGKRADRSSIDFDVVPANVRDAARRAWEANESAGRVIGTVELMDCVVESRSPWAMEGCWHWLVANPRRYARSVRAKGQLNMWEWRRRE